MGERIQGKEEWWSNTKKGPWDDCLITNGFKLWSVEIKSLAKVPLGDYQSGKVCRSGFRPIHFKQCSCIFTFGTLKISYKILFEKYALWQLLVKQNKRFIKHCKSKNSSLTMKNQKKKLRNQSHSPLQQKE